MKPIFKFMSLLLLAMVLSCSDTDRNSDPWERYDIYTSKMTRRDPFILVDRENGYYYLHVNGRDKTIRVYESWNLQRWRELEPSFVPDADFWGTDRFWAPDVYRYKGRYYMLLTLSSDEVAEGVGLLVSDYPQGPFVPHINAPITPADARCLDGSLHITPDGIPWLLYCRAWTEVTDGQICAVRLSEDLKSRVGEPVILFRASEAKWVGAITSGSSRGNVTDAPFVYRHTDGKLIMLWSSFSKAGKYAIGQATSVSGDILGPWIQSEKPLNDDDGGHAMLFNDLDGQLMISYHAPNKAPERPVFKPVKMVDGKVVIQ